MSPSQRDLNFEWHNLSRNISILLTLENLNQGGGTPDNNLVAWLVNFLNFLIFVMYINLGSTPHDQYRMEILLSHPTSSRLRYIEFHFSKWVSGDKSLQEGYETTLNSEGEFERPVVGRGNVIRVRNKSGSKQSLAVGMYFGLTDDWP